MIIRHLRSGWTSQAADGADYGQDIRAAGGQWLGIFAAYHRERGFDRKEESKRCGWDLETLDFQTSWLHEAECFYVLCRSSSVPWAKDQLDIEQEANKKCEYSETPSHQCEEQTNPLRCATDIKETINQIDLPLDSWLNKLNKPICTSEKKSPCSLWDMLETHPACGAVKAHWADLPGATPVSSHGTWTRGWELKMLDPEGQGRSKVAKRYQRWIWSKYCSEQLGYFFWYAKMKEWYRTWTNTKKH